MEAPLRDLRQRNCDGRNKPDRHILPGKFSVPNADVMTRGLGSYEARYKGSHGAEGSPNVFEMYRKWGKRKRKKKRERREGGSRSSFYITSRILVRLWPRLSRDPFVSRTVLKVGTLRNVGYTYVRV